MIVGYPQILTCPFCGKEKKSCHYGLGTLLTKNYGRTTNK